MTEEELIETLKAFEHKRVEQLSENSRNLFYAIMSIADERYKYKNIVDELEKHIEEEKTRLCKECSNVYEDSLGKTKQVNEDIFNELSKMSNKLKELKGE